LKEGYVPLDQIADLTTFNEFRYCKFYLIIENNNSAIIKIRERITTEEINEQFSITHEMSRVLAKLVSTYDAITFVILDLDLPRRIARFADKFSKGINRFSNDQRKWNLRCAKWCHLSGDTILFDYFEPRFDKSTRQRIIAQSTTIGCWLTFIYGWHY
jgi:hypothetical protein